MRAAWLMPLVAMVACSCAAAMANRAASMETRVDRLEHAELDHEALGRGDTRTTHRTLSDMAGWIAELERDTMLSPADRTRLADRVRAARTRFRFAAAAITQPPDLGFALATAPIAYSERTDNHALERPEYLAMVRHLADARTAMRQAQVAKAGTYAVREGKVGNCVVATRPFGAEGTPNPGLTFRPVAGQLVYVRCYPKVSLRALPRRAGSFFGAGTMMSAPRLDLEHVDFTTRFGEKQPISRGLTLRYEYTHDNVVVWERGVARVRADRRSVVLASSPILIDTPSTNNAITRR